MMTPNEVSKTNALSRATKNAYSAMFALLAQRVSEMCSPSTSDEQRKVLAKAVLKVLDNTLSDVHALIDEAITQ